MTTRSMSNDVRTKTIIPDRSQPIPNKRFSRRKTTLRPCTFTRNWNDKAQSVDAVPSVSESQQPLYHSYRRETRSMSSTCSHEENVVDVSPPEQTDRPSTRDHNRQRKTRYLNNDTTGEDERIEDVQNDGSQSEDGVSEPATNGGQHHLSNLHQYDTGESQGNMSNASTWSRLRNANKPCKDISQVTCTRPGVPLISSFQSAAWGAPEVNWTSDHHKSDMSESDHASHLVNVDIPMLNINETGDASCRQPGDTSHCHPGDVSRHQSGDASYRQQGDTSSCHQPGDTSHGQPDDNPRDQPSHTPRCQPHDTPRGPLGDPSKLLSSLHRLGVDGRARLTGVHPTTPGKSSIRKPASARPVSALSPRRASQMSTSRTRNRAITGAHRAKGRQTKSSILVQQESHQTKQVDYAEEAKRLESEISQNRAKMEDENSELLSLQDEHARLKAGAPTTRKSSNQTTGKKRLDSRSSQSGYELKEKRLKLGIFRTRSRIRKIKAETLSLQQELTGLKSDHAEQAFKRKEKSRSSQNVKQITKFLNKLEELQQTFSASKMTQSGAYEVFGSVLDVVRDKLPGTAKVLSQLTAMEDNVRQSLA